MSDFLKKALEYILNNKLWLQNKSQLVSLCKWCFPKTDCWHVYSKWRWDKIRLSWKTLPLMQFHQIYKHSYKRWAIYWIPKTSFCQLWGREKKLSVPKQQTHQSKHNAKLFNISIQRNPQAATMIHDSTNKHTQTLNSIGNWQITNLYATNGKALYLHLWCGYFRVKSLFSWTIYIILSVQYSFLKGSDAPFNANIPTVLPTSHCTTKVTITKNNQRAYTHWCI